MDLRKYGVATHLYKPILKRGVVDFAWGVDWTPVAGDVKISKNGGAAANVTNLPVAIAMGNTAMWDFSLTAAEVQAAQIKVTVADAATKVVEDQFLEIETYGDASAQHIFDLSAVAITAAQVNAEVLDVLTVDTFAEPASPPAATSSLKDKILWVFTVARNKITQTATTQLVRNDSDAATIGTSTVSDDGTTFSRGKYS